MNWPWALACAVLLAPGCGGDDSSAVQDDASPKATIVMTDSTYRPAEVRIEVGGRVTWVNGSQTANTAETDGAGFFATDRRDLDERNVFDLHTLQPGEADSVEFDTPGRYRFHSSLNDRMRGVVEVVDTEEDDG